MYPDDFENGSLMDTHEGFKKCMEVISLILDGEADEETIRFFEEKIKCCQKSMMFYNLEKTIKEILKNKVESKEVPPELLIRIKEKIAQSWNK